MVFFMKKDPFVRTYLWPGSGSIIYPDKRTVCAPRKQTLVTDVECGARIMSLACMILYVIFPGGKSMPRQSKGVFRKLNGFVFATNHNSIALDSVAVSPYI